MKEVFSCRQRAPRLGFIWHSPSILPHVVYGRLKLVSYHVLWFQMNKVEKSSQREAEQVLGAPGHLFSDMVKGICLMVESLESGSEHALVVSKRNLRCFSCPKHPLVKVSLTWRALTQSENSCCHCSQRGWGTCEPRLTGRGWWGIQTQHSPVDRVMAFWWQ